MNENVMEHMDGLGLSVSDRFTCLRKRLDDVGCVFEFVIMPVKEGASIDEQCHRLALAKLYEQVMFSQMEWFRRLIQSLSVADYPEPTMRWNLAEAFAEQMTQQQILSLCGWMLISTKRLLFTPTSLAHFVCLVRSIVLG